MTRPAPPAWHVDRIDYLEPDGTAATAAVLRSAADRRPQWTLGDRFHHVVEQTVRSMGPSADRRVAIETATRSVSYRELDRLARRLAHCLHARGVGPGSRVALLLDRSELAPAVVLACSRLAAAYVPLDAGFPTDRLEFIVADAEVELAVTVSRLAGRLETCGVEVLDLDHLGAELDAAPAQDIELHTDEVDPLAYVVYTSGTTGRPKGVPIRHSSFCNFVRVAGDCYGYRPDDRVYQGLTMAFDFSVEEVWVPLVSGATLVPAPADETLVGAELQSFLGERRITAMCCVPTLLATLQPTLPQLRLLLVSGEACPRDLIDPWLADGNRRVINAYGPTEATVTATWTVLTPGRPVTIGGPLPTYRVVILDPVAARSVEVGEVGELAIAGIGLSSGYLARPEQTARAFVPCPFPLRDNPSGMLYRTGDLARITETNEIEYLGRLDSQVKIRGYRIELEEIEAVARAVPGVGNAVVQPFRAPGAVQDELVLYLATAVPSGPLDVDGVLEAMRRTLPAYMVPAYVEVLDALPLLASTKVDRRALPPPRGPRHVGGTRAVVAPATPLEHRLAELLGELLGLDEVSVEAHFLDELGANSLTLAGFVTAIRDRLDRSVPVKLLYQHPTVARLARAMELDPIGPARAADRQVRPFRPAAPHVPGRVATALTAAGQAIVAVAAIALTSAIPITALRWVDGATGPVAFYGRSVVAGAAGFFGLSAALVALKWLAIGRLGTAPIRVYSWRYLRFWVARRAVQANPMHLLAGSPLYPWFLRSLGASVGRGAVVLSRFVACPDLVRIGAGAVVRDRVVMNGYTVRDGIVQPGRVEIGAGALVCEATVLDIDVRIGAGATVGHASGVLRGQWIPDGQTYQGSPAEPSGTSFDRVPPWRPSPGRARRYALVQLVLLCCGRLAGFYVVLHVVHRAGVAVSSLTTFEGRIGRLADIAVLAALVVLGGLAAAMVRVVAMSRLLRRLVVPDRVHPLYGWQYGLARAAVRYGNSRQLVLLFGDSALIVPYLRAIGYDMRNATQTGSNVGTVLRQHAPFLCGFDRDTLVSDGLSIMNLEVSAGSFLLRRVRIPPDTYLGNAVSFPVGATVGADCLIATKAAVPIDGPMRRSVGLLGSPAFEIPRTVARDHEFDDLKRPEVVGRLLTEKLWANLLTMELLVIRSWLLTFVAFVAVVDRFPGFTDADVTVGESVVTSTAGVVLAALLSVPLLVVFDRASRGFAPLSPRFCSLYDARFWDHERTWKLNFVGFLAPFAGTPLRPVLLRLAGARVGRGVFDDGAVLTEPSLVTIGDGCTLNAGVTIQSHSLEDGAFKSDHITIGRNCTIATGAFVHYAADLRDDAVVEADSFVMKGTRADRASRWLGNPAREHTDPEPWPAPRPVPGEVVASDAAPLVSVATPFGPDLAPAPAAAGVEPGRRSLGPVTSPALDGRPRLVAAR